MVNNKRLKMMNKKGALGIQAFLTRAFIMGIIIFMFVTIFGVGGGFKATFELGQLVAKVPVWFWLVIAILWLFSAMRGK